MSEPIKVGDLVIVIHICCDGVNTPLGKITTIAEIRHNVTCCDKCGQRNDTTHAASIQNFQNGLPLSWLKRIPPLAELEGEKRDEEITA